VELNTFNNLRGWIDHLQSQGKLAFSLAESHEAFPNLSETAVKLALHRLSKKEKIISIYKGYYLIIPPQYASKGILPPSLYIDGLMRFLERRYYVGLISAAALHGAAHQQPQEFFVVTTLPPLRATERKGIKVNYISKKSVTKKLIESRKTESGYLQVSSPALTATDLIQFEKRIGGLNRAATVITELAEVLRPEMFSADLFDEVSTYSIQRLGYILEYKAGRKELADALLENVRKAGLSFFRIPLKADHPVQGFSSCENWKVIVNTDIEIDE
jgi:predicted transcriptional regulator of viral defense system